MWLIERMKHYREAPAMVWRKRTISYVSLLRLMAAWQSVLEKAGLKPASVIAFEGDFSPRSCALLLALIQRGSIAVPLSRHAAQDRDQFLEVAEAQALITFGDEDRWNLIRRRRTITNPLTLSLTSRAEPGLVLFSSGSTGKSKAALHSFPRLLDKFKSKRHRFRTIAFLLMDHIGGINTLLYTLANGGTLVTVPGRDPFSVCKEIEANKAELLPATPTFLNLLLISGAYRQSDLSSLKLITYGTEVMPETTLQRLKSVMPAVRLLQTYGLSELGILRSKSRDSTSLWVKIGGDGFETKVIDGTLWIRAHSAMLGYLNAPDPFDAEGWFNTHDLVEVRGDYLRVLGRKSDIINVGGQKVYPAEVEDVLLRAPGVADATVYGEKNAILGQIVVAEVSTSSPEDPARLRRRLRSFCRTRLAPYKTPLKVKILDQPQATARYKKPRTATKGG